LISQLRERNKIYLLTKKLKIKKLRIKKLELIKVELFFIKVVKRSINYELDLFKNAKVFLVFYILLLKPIDSNISI